MSPQLTLSSLFSLLALASLCVVTSVGEHAGLRPAEAPQLLAMQAELAPGLLAR